MFDVVVVVTRIDLVLFFVESIKNLLDLGVDAVNVGQLFLVHLINLPERISGFD